MTHGWNRHKSSLDDEIREHIALETQENIEAGMSPEEARHAAMRKFGNVVLAQERSREVWGWLWLERLLQDLRYALRGLKNAPGYAVTVVLTLALGLGSVTAMLAIVDSVLLRPLALPRSKQLVMIYGKSPRDGRTYELGYKQMEALRRDTHSLAAVSGYNAMARPIGAQDGNRMALQIEVAPQFFEMLGVAAKQGRLLNAADGKSPVAVVSAAFWRERMHSDPKAIGSTIRVSGQPRTVVGVLPEGVHVPQGIEGPMVYTPISLNAKGEDELFGDSAVVMARLKPGVSRQQALAETRSVFAHRQTDKGSNQQTIEMTSYANYLTGDLETPLLALTGGVVVLLLIACANTANLQIARATSRMAEMHTRSALGATFVRLLQQLVTESIVASLLGALLGGALAYALVAIVRNVYGPNYSRFDELAVRPAVLAVSALLALIIGALASLAPALHIRRQTNVAKTTKHITQASRVPAFLVALQIALTCVLLIISGLFVQTLRSLQQVRLGFDPHGVTTLILMPEDQHKNPELSRQADTHLLERFNSLPGVQAATMQTAIPFSNYNFTLNGRTVVNNVPFHEGDTAFYSLVSSNFVEASGIRLLRGRGFLPRDDSSPTMVAVVNQAFVQKYLPGKDPLGASVRFHRAPGEKDSDLPFTQALTVVGVVENELQGGNLGAPYDPMVYMDYLQLPQSSPLSEIFSMMAQLAVRSTLPQAELAKELRAGIRQAAPDMAEMQLQPMEEGIAHSLGERRLALRLVGSFGGAALLLSAIGIYGVLAYSVVLRRREIGIRMALGCSRGGATRLVIRQAGAMVLFGLLPGIAAAWAASHLVKSFLFGVKTLDPPTLASAAVLLLLVSTLAAGIPVLRAAQVDPMEAIRTE